MTDQPMAPAPDQRAADTAHSIVDTILDLDEFLSGDVRRARKSARICTKPDLEAELDRLQQELESLTDERGEPLTAPGDEAMGSGRTATSVAREHRGVQLEYAAAMRQIVVEAMPSPQWKAWHKANEKELELDDVPDEVYNDLIVKCAVQPPISAAKLTELRERIGHAQVNEIALAAWEVNTKSGVSVPKSLLSSHVLKRQERAKS